MKYILSVTEINRYIKELVAGDLVLSNLWVRGEISNYKAHTSGHRYFTLKDESGLIRCVMFRGQAANLKFAPADGMKVILRGYVSVFERDGQYQLYAEEMQPDGTGSLHIAFEQLKTKLRQEGLFETAEKKPIPMLPASIGVITSPTGAVIRDIIHVLTRRFPNICLKLYPVAVQGEGAAEQIAHALDKLNEKACVDVIILARGGGSLEELWAFNEEIVARSIFRSRIPVISAVGHETDFTIADFVADLRAPTPSAAAELAVPEKVLLQGRIGSLQSRLGQALYHNLAVKKSTLERLSGSHVLRQPFDRVYQERMRLDILSRYLHRESRNCCEKGRSRLAMLAGKLDALSPLTVLARGYSVVRQPERKLLVKSIKGIASGDRMEIQVTDGSLDCVVTGIKGREQA